MRQPVAEQNELAVASRRAQIMNSATALQPVAGQGLWNSVSQSGAAASPEQGLWNSVNQKKSVSGRRSGHPGLLHRDGLLRAGEFPPSLALAGAS